MKSLREIYAENKPSSFSLFGSDRNAAKRKIYQSIICPTCLKSIVVAKLDFTCPFCDKEYRSFAEKPVNVNEMKELTDFFGVALEYSRLSSAHERALFEACGECNGEIKYLECPHCKKKVDLFAPYDYEGLKRKRYE